MCVGVYVHVYAFYVLHASFKLALATHAVESDGGDYAYVQRNQGISRGLIKYIDYIIKTI